MERGRDKGRRKGRKGDGKVKGRGRKKGERKGKAEGEGRGEWKVKWGRKRWKKKGKGKERGRWKEDSLRKVGSTDEHTGRSGDFMLCLMLCIPLDRQLVYCTLTAVMRYSAKMAAPKHPQRPKGERRSGHAQMVALECPAPFLYYLAI